MQRSSFHALVLAVLFTASLSAQQVPDSTISGRVFCADTNSPARFAKVLLKSTVPSHIVDSRIQFEQASRQKDAAESGQPLKPLTDDEKRSTVAEARMDSLDFDMQNSSTAGLDGAFSFSGVRPGTYFVHVIFAGYIDSLSQFSDSDFASTDPAIRALVAKLPTITVSGTDSARIDLRIERGAAASGRILFDDGSPAAGWAVSALQSISDDDARDAQTVFRSQILSFGYGVPIAKTDDLGRFRLSGLAAGEYTLRATLLAPASGPRGMGNMTDNGLILTVYSGDTFSHAKAKPVRLVAGEERAGADINIPSRELHNIAGQVVARSDGHAINAGQVVLTAKDDPSVHLVAHIQKDSGFSFEYLPGGITYTLNVTANDIQSVPSEKKQEEAVMVPTVFVGDESSGEEIIHRFGSATTTVALHDADIDTLRIAVPDRSEGPGK